MAPLARSPRTAPLPLCRKLLALSPRAGSIKHRAGLGSCTDLEAGGILFGKTVPGPEWERKAFTSHRISLALGVMHTGGSRFIYTDRPLYCAGKNHPEYQMVFPKLLLLLPAYKVLPCCLLLEAAALLSRPKLSGLLFIFSFQTKFLFI